MLDDALNALGPSAFNRFNLRSLFDQLERIIICAGAGISMPFGYPGWADALRKIVELEKLDEASAKTIDNLILDLKFEEAATFLLDRIGEREFNRRLVDLFSDEMLDRPISAHAASNIPHIANDVVLTTNFDRVLECSFYDHGSQIDVLRGRFDLKDADGFLHSGRKALIKLHGDFLLPSSRVLTLSEYEEAYGSADPEDVDFALPLPRALSLALLARPTLFIGCSLKGDRTTRVIGRLAREFPGTTHFAVLPDSDDTIERNRELSDWNIRPLFFTDGEFDRVDRFVDILASEVRRRRAGPSAKRRRHFIPDSRLDRPPPRRLSDRVRRLLRAKLRTDFRLSWLGIGNDLNLGLEAAYHQLELARLASAGSVRLGPGTAPILRTDYLSEAERLALQAVLRTASPIRVNCAALFPAALSVLLGMRDDLRRADVEVEVDWKQVNSHNQLSMLARETEFYDYLIAADAAFFMFKDINFRKLLTCHEEYQWLVTRKSERDWRHFILKVFSQSTAEMQWEMKQGFPKGKTFEKDLFDFGERIPFFRSTLSPGEALLVWEPLAYGFLRDINFMRLNEVPLSLSISLFAHRRMMHRTRADQREAFIRLFVDYWRLLSTNLPNAEARFLSELGTLEMFAQSAGVIADPRFETL